MGLGPLVRRIRSKSPSELAARSAEALRMPIERMRVKAGAAAPSARLRRFITREFTNAPSERLLAWHRTRADVFFPSIAQGPQMRELFATRYAGELEATRAWAERARRHEYLFFGR